MINVVNHHIFRRIHDETMHKQILAICSRNNIAFRINPPAAVFYLFIVFDIKGERLTLSRISNHKVVAKLVVVSAFTHFS